MSAKAKGTKGENEACEWLRIHLFDKQFTPQVNQNQSGKIGADIVIPPFIVEVKRRETLSLGQWWIQVKKVEKWLNKQNRGFIPVVMYRQNNKPWEFLISTDEIGVDNGGYVRIDNRTFIKWAKRYRYNLSQYE